MPEYRYSRLSQPDRSIRLLQLLPRREDPKNLRCKLFQCPLRNSEEVTRPYEALSYCWGVGHKTQSIIIVDDQKGEQKAYEELAVMPNLYTVLLHLQDHDIPRIIWVDAVCIDQSETREKEVQISLMAEIYAKASRVIVWLGEARDDVNEALKGIRVAAKTSMDLSKTQFPRQGISALLKRPWFYRIWVRAQSCSISPQ